jgi:predicted DNA-binding ribbon-helix-helix protein
VSAERAPRVMDRETDTARSAPGDAAGSETADFQFRVFRRGDERRAFRLERVFWELLEQAASAKGQRLRDLVFSLIDQEPDAKNLASSLRTAGAKWANDRHAALMDAAPPSSGLVMFHACPSPGIIIGEDRRIVAFNTAMQKFIAVRRPNALKSDMVNARFAFELPVGQIIKFLVEAPGKFMECGFRIVLGEESITGRCRVCLYKDGKPGARQLGAFIIL